VIRVQPFVPLPAPDFCVSCPRCGRPPLACNGRPANRRACGQIRERKWMPEALVLVLQNNSAAARESPGSCLSLSAKAATACARLSRSRQSSAASRGSLTSGPLSRISARELSGHVMPPRYIKQTPRGQRARWETLTRINPHLRFSTPSAIGRKLPRPIFQRGVRTEIFLRANSREMGAPSPEPI
jgi:hypothetical protein